jgi:hypothetical protein
MTLKAATFRSSYKNKQAILNTGYDLRQKGWKAARVSTGKVFTGSEVIFRNKLVPCLCHTVIKSLPSM